MMAVFNSATVLVSLSTLLLSLTPTVAVSPETLEILSHIEGSIDHSADPCDDFYQYACGNFKNLPNESVSDAILTWATEKYDDDVAQIIRQENPTLQPQEQSVMDKVRIVARSCDYLNNNWQLARYLDEIKPGPGVEWPVLQELYQGEYALNSWPAHSVDIVQLAAILHSHGINKIFLIHVPYLDEKKLAVGPYDTELKPEDVEEILKDLALPHNIVSKYRDDIMEFHKGWQLMLQYHMSIDGEKILQIHEAQQKYPALASYLETAFPGDILQIPGMKLQIYNPTFMQLLTKQWDAMEKRRFCNYIMIKYLQHVKSQHTTKCAEDLRKKMQLAVNYMYYENKYVLEAETIERLLLPMIKNIFSDFHDVVKENRMNFNREQMDVIMSRVLNSSVNIGNLPQNVTNARVEEFYKYLLPMDINNFYKNDLALLMQNHIELYRPARLLEWQYFRDDDIAPYTNPLARNVIVPFATVHMPSFHYDLDDIFTLSGLGFYLGHELTHIIDPNKWTLLDIDILKNEVGIKNSIDCMMQQQPTAYMAERICDLAGIRAVYRTYARLNNRQPSFSSRTWQQLLFLNVAQTFCSKVLDKPTGHDAGDIRVREIAKNTEEFAEAFQCPWGSRMNPVEKCNMF